MTGKPVRNLHGDFSLPLMALHLIILDGVFSRETWMGVEEWTDVELKLCHFNTFFNT
jgi:hypothetical protein